MELWRGYRVCHVCKYIPTYVHILCLHLLMDFNIASQNVGYDNISSKFDLQGPGLKVKVTGYF